MDSGSDKIFRNLERMAKKHKVECDLILDGSRAVSLSLKNKGDKLSVTVKINDLKKVLTTPELLKTGLSFLARKKDVSGKIEVNIETGVFKKLFGKK